MKIGLFYDRHYIIEYINLKSKSFPRNQNHPLLLTTEYLPFTLDI